MNWYKKYIEAGKVQEEPNKYSWVRLDCDADIKDIHKGYTETINEKDLYILEQKGNNWSYGTEDKPHITTKWGINFDDPKKVIEVLEGEEGGEVMLDKIEVFDNDDNYDVLVILCESEALQRLHKKLTDDLEIEDTYPEYKPHITIAYFKKGRAKQYVKSATKAFTDLLLAFSFDELIFENRKNEETKIKLD